MPTVIDLPAEVVAMILWNLDDIESVCPALLASRHIYSAFKENPGIQAAAVRRQVTPALLPYAIAVMEASCLPHPRTEAAALEVLGQIHVDSSRLEAKVRALSLGQALLLARKHRLICNLASLYAVTAWAFLGSGDAPLAPDIDLSPAERFRFRRAFYRVELFHSLFRPNESDSAAAVEASSNMNAWYGRNHSPWENEQLACVHTFLETTFAKASVDVLLHDIENGVFGSFALSPHTTSNWAHFRLAQGVDFVQKLMSAESYDAKRTLLTSTLNRDAAYLRPALATASEVGREDGVSLETYSQEKFESLAPQDDREDCDHGPWEMWGSVYHHSPVSDWVASFEGLWLRERAYVLWDLKRILDHNLHPIIGAGPEGFAPSLSLDNCKILRESIRERAKIWQMAGSAQWTKTDLDAIRWPCDPPYED